MQYADTHGGGTIGVSSQSSAAAMILSSGADVAGLGGFSGRESSVTASWIASEVSSGRLRWIVADQGASFVAPGDTRTGSRQALAVVARTCPALTLTTSNGTKITMYDCKGRADAIRAAVRA
ncbi:MAG: hypothetical protein JO206_09015 [Solirubrobacterales bacterium]|nr:hypothetical protein [Solirubrobacterales bacterium]